MDHGRVVKIVFAVLSPRSEKLVLGFVLVGCVHNLPGSPRFPENLDNHWISS